MDLDAVKDPLPRDALERNLVGRGFRLHQELGVLANVVAACPECGVRQSRIDVWMKESMTLADYGRGALFPTQRTTLMRMRSCDHLVEQFTAHQLGTEVIDAEARDVTDRRIDPPRGVIDVPSRDA